MIDWQRVARVGNRRVGLEYWRGAGGYFRFPATSTIQQLEAVPRHSATVRLFGRVLIVKWEWI